MITQDIARLLSYYNINQIFGINENLPEMRQRERDNDHSFRFILFFRSGITPLRSSVESSNPSLETSQSQRDNL